jgi:hypothetical protein
MVGGPRSPSHAMTPRHAFAFALWLAGAHCGGQVTLENSTQGPSKADAGSSRPDAGVAPPGSDAASPGTDAGPPGRTCASHSDCSGGAQCAFTAALACGYDSQRCTTGTCTMPTGPEPCGAVSTVIACGCDGIEVHWAGGCGAIFPANLAPVPFAHLGPCQVGKSCMSASDCNPDETCGFTAGAGCSAKGQCISVGACNCDSECCRSTAAVGCDGASAEVNCEGYGNKPVCLNACE